MPHGWENMSGKMAVLGRMLALLRADTDDRCVQILPQLILKERYCLFTFVLKFSSIKSMIFLLYID